MSQRAIPKSIKFVISWTKKRYLRWTRKIFYRVLSPDRNARTAMKWIKRMITKPLNKKISQLMNVLKSISACMPIWLWAHSASTQFNLLNAKMWAMPLSMQLPKHDLQNGYRTKLKMNGAGMLFSAFNAHAQASDRLFFWKKYFFIGEPLCYFISETSLRCSLSSAINSKPPEFVRCQYGQPQNSHNSFSLRVRSLLHPNKFLHKITYKYLKNRYR